MSVNTRTTTTIICDRCGVKQTYDYAKQGAMSLLGNKNWKHIVLIQLGYDDGSYSHPPTAILCGDCVRELRDFCSGTD
mgnify:FL=1